MDKGLLRYAVMDQPLPIHKMAAKAAEACHCANDQGKYWEMHKLIMSNQESIADLSSYAVSLNLDLAKFDDCLKTNKYKEQIEKEAALAKKLGITGVPGFIIASWDPQNPTKAKGISFMRGSVPFSNFQVEIDKALAGIAQQEALH